MNAVYFGTDLKSSRAELPWQHRYGELNGSYVQLQNKAMMWIRLKRGDPMFISFQSVFFVTARCVSDKHIKQWLSQKAPTTVKMCA